MDSKEVKNKRIAFLVSLGLHASLFLTFFFLVSWRAPYPPDRQIGMELNFGLDNQGGGDIQPDKPVGNANTEDNKSIEQKSEENNKANPNEKVEPQKSEAQEEKKDAGVVSDEESNVIVKTDKKKKDEKVKEADTKKETKQAETKKPVIKKEALYTDKSGTKKGETNQSQGDDPGKVGDKGNPQGKLDAKALYGKPGGGGGGDGFGLAMAGWKWATTPKTPDLPDNEDGRIIFEIECDEDGEIIGITTIERGLSPRAEQLLKDEIRKNSLIKESSGQAPQKSKGRVVFVLKTK